MPFNASMRGNFGVQSSKQSSRSKITIASSNPYVYLVADDLTSLSTWTNRTGTGNYTYLGDSTITSNWSNNKKAVFVGSGTSNGGYQNTSHASHLRTSGDTTFFFVGQRVSISSTRAAVEFGGYYYDGQYRHAFFPALDAQGTFNKYIQAISISASKNTLTSVYNYLNTTVATAPTFNRPWPTTSNTLNLGNGNSAVAYNLNGYIGSFILYNRELSELEMKDIIIELSQYYNIPITGW